MGKVDSGFVFMGQEIKLVLVETCYVGINEQRGFVEVVRMVFGRRLYLYCYLKEQGFYYDKFFVVFWIRFRLCMIGCLRFFIICFLLVCGGFFFIIFLLLWLYGIIFYFILCFRFRIFFCLFFIQQILVYFVGFS